MSEKLQTVAQLEDKCVDIRSNLLNFIHRNGMGHAHGGAIFALVDMTFATVSNAAGLYCVNAQTNISYLEPGRIGPLRGEARKIRSGRNLGTYDVRITDSDGTLVAIATVTGFMTKYPIQPKDA